MDKAEVIAMLKSLIANIENDHVQIVAVEMDEAPGTATLNIEMQGAPQIMRVDE